MRIAKALECAKVNNSLAYMVYSSSKILNLKSGKYTAFSGSD